MYNFLENFTVDRDNRVECYVQEDFGYKALEKVHLTIKSFRKPTEFDLMAKKLDSLQPIRVVSHQF